MPVFYKLDLKDTVKRFRRKTSELLTTAWSESGINRASRSCRTFRIRKEMPDMNRYLLVVATHALAMSVISALICSTAYGQIVCDRFQIVTNLRDAALELSVQTDLPDNTLVMVSISRSYLEKGNPATYSCDYLSEKSTVGKWKTKQTVVLDNQKWNETLRDKQEKMSRLGAGFDVASISDKVDVRMVVPIGQPDPRFGDKNSKLSGNRVSEKRVRVVGDEISFAYPMQSPPLGSFPVQNLDPLNLENGQSYVVSKQTPLMPELEPADPLAAIQRMKQIPKGGAFKIHEVRKKGTSPWYRVVAIDQNMKNIGAGWINSTALLDQDLKPYK